MERLKTRYFTEARHDLRTALDTVSGGVTLAGRHCKDPEKVQSCLTRVRPALHELEALIADDPFNREVGVATATPDVSLPDLAGRRVLLADDNELNRGIIRELLEDSGMLVDTAATGTQAVKKLETAAPGHYDYILMDLLMPEMNGFEAARAIRALPEPARAGVPIIAMTAGVDEEDRRRATEAGMNGFAPKPLRLERLFGLMREASSAAAGL